MPSRNESLSTIVKTLDMTQGQSRQNTKERQNTGESNEYNMHI